MTNHGIPPEYHVSIVWAFVNRKTIIKLKTIRTAETERSKLFGAALDEIIIRRQSLFCKELHLVWLKIVAVEWPA